jgi:hypothetical protein
MTSTLPSDRQLTKVHVRWGALAVSRSLSNPDLATLQDAVGEGIVQLSVGVPKGEERVAVAGGPRRRKSVDKILGFLLGH